VRNATHEERRRERQAHDFEHALGRWLILGEGLVLLGIILVLLASGLYILLDAAQNWTRIVASGASVDAVLPIAEDALLALILAELVRTIAATAQHCAGSAQPLDPSQA
jgi:hypothetical protein